MRKKKKPSLVKFIDCNIDLPPRGCSGIFPFEGCTNPTIQLDAIGTISCEGIISGRVLCDYQPLQGVTVNLSSSFPGLVFDNPNPVTDSTGRFSTKVTVVPGTSIIPNVIVTATAVVIGKEVRDSMSVRVDCIKCKHPELTLDTIKEPVGCKGAKLSGRLICDGRAIGNAAISFIIESQSKRVVITPNPAITQGDGEFTATLVLFPEVNETISITASTKIGGKTVTSETREVKVRCAKCKKPDIKLGELKKIDCCAVVRGKVTCDGVPQSNITVILTGSPILKFRSSAPVTNEKGEFSSVVKVKNGTDFQSAFYTAKAVVSGKTVEDTDQVMAGCNKCKKPKLTLEVPCEVIPCEGTKLTGQLTCDGTPIRNAAITITIIDSSPGAVEVNPNPAWTNEQGEYETKITPVSGKSEDISIQAMTIFGDKMIKSMIKTVKIHCQCKDPTIELDHIKEIDCCGKVSGKVCCDKKPLNDVKVKLSSPVLRFEPDVVYTDELGRFSSAAKVPQNTPFEDVKYSASTEIEDEKKIVEKAFVYAGCQECREVKLTFKVPPKVRCKGACLTGKVLCDSKPLENLKVHFEVKEKDYKSTVAPNPAITDKEGHYSSKIIPNHGMQGRISIRAFVVIDDKKIYTKPYDVHIECVCPPEECSCKND
ncbi:hypothetical protein [Rossellomorea yichunensis]|uniref:hypothetical protein n=1 Tax=Rossellomorea yichunensis TaxID=3077331 RepID=UPI0028DF7A68|nr:hypothetical protein [Rossellomorea sp. YC4-1]MDT9027492.1 hypothetical protein [Rossellomorea sp. YC4-1]